MASKNTKAQSKFRDDLVKSWENTDGVNFAIALARMTGWLLHVDWWGTDNTQTENNMVPLRVYVGTDRDIIYDFTGKRRIEAFNQYVILPIAKKRAHPPIGAVITRFYSEEKLLSLPLRVKASEIEITKAEDAIKNNKSFLDKIIVRLNPHIPAEWAAQFSFGWCTVYAAALEDVRGYQATAIIVSRYTEQFQNTKPGFCHCVIVHPDGEMEDSWGKQPVQNVLERFGIEGYSLSREEYQKALESIKINSHERYDAAYTKASNFLKVL
ncbi:hypothetical protein [Chitinophaga defluvii]|uniref:Uncharacterized protein n=1 Tax=Chitinophaga defluvii TaxID=3163343 RepID=A0ABV2T046_9BACT